MAASRMPLPVVLAVLILMGACAPDGPAPPPPAAIATAMPSTGTSPATRAPSSPPIGRRPLLIDTDVAPDDLVAIAFLLASPKVEIKAITVSGTGEAHCDGGVDVVLRLLERLDAPTIDVACGRETPIAGDLAFPDAWRAGADDGSGLALPSTSRQAFAGDAVQLIAKTADEVDGLRILTLGPMTNLADALSGHPALAGRLESVYAMGGALFVPGNVGFGGPPDNAGRRVEHLRRSDGRPGGDRLGAHGPSRSASTAPARCPSPRSSRRAPRRRRPDRAGSCSLSSSLGIRS